MLKATLMCTASKSYWFGAASSPFMLNAVLHLHLTNYNSKVTETMQQNLYIDNIISVVKTQSPSILRKQGNHVQSQRQPVQLGIQ